MLHGDGGLVELGVGSEDRGDRGVAKSTCLGNLSVTNSNEKSEGVFD